MLSKEALFNLKVGTTCPPCSDDSLEKLRLQAFLAFLQLEREKLEAFQSLSLMILNGPNCGS